VIAIGDIIRAKGLTQAQRTRLGLAQPDVSKLLRGQFSGYTYDRLFSYLNALGEKVRIKVSEAKTKKRLELEVA
jgi:predicted XRE-type DNA-binding protein